MAVVIDARSAIRRSPDDKLLRLFPVGLRAELDGFYRRGTCIYEVRLRAEKCASIVCDTGNIALSCVVSRAELTEILTELCEHSLYAHADTICGGYITLEGGVRVGVVGRAAVSGGRVCGVYDISSLCFRFPQRIESVGENLAAILREKRCGALIYSPPGVGKTTLLRSLVARLADFDSSAVAMRVAVVDTRGELGVYLNSKALCVDVLSGYPRGIGIEIAARSLNAELAVCDELCGKADVDAVIQSRNSGVPVLATAHAQSLEALMRKSDFRRLHEACAFEYYVGIQRLTGRRDFEYDVVSWEEADQLI